MENIKEYLKYYIGQRCEYKITTIGKGKIVGIMEHIIWVETETGEIVSPSVSDQSDAYVRPILKKLSDMTEEDAAECEQLQTNAEGWLGEDFEDYAKSFHYLLSKGYWLWDQSAFTSGLILDAKNVK